MRLAWNQVTPAHMQQVRDADGTTVPVTTIALDTVEIDFPTQTMQGTVQRWGHRVDAVDQQPGVAGLANYQYGLALTLYVPTGTSLVVHGSWQMTGAEGTTWPATTTLSVRQTSTGTSRENLDTLFVGLPFTVQTDATTWADYTITSYTRGTTTLITGSLVESSGTPTLTTGDQGDLYWGPVSTVVKKVYAPTLPFLVVGSDFERIFTEAIPWADAGEAGPLSFKDLLMQLFAQGHLKNSTTWK